MWTTMHKQHYQNRQLSTGTLSGYWSVVRRISRPSVHYTPKGHNCEKFNNTKCSI